MTPTSSQSGSSGHLFGDRVRGNESAPPEYVAAEGVVIAEQKLTWESLIHFDRRASGSVWLSDSCLIALEEGSSPTLRRLAPVLAISSLALVSLFYADDGGHTEPDVSRDSGELVELDLHAPAVTGVQHGVEYLRLATDLRVATQEVLLRATLPDHGITSDESSDQAAGNVEVSSRYLPGPPSG